MESPAPLWRQALGVFRRQIAKATLTFAAVFAATIAYTLGSPLLYTSNAKVFVRLGRETIALDPTATTGQTVTVQDTRENEINSVQELLKSQAILDALVDEFGPAAILDVPAVEVHEPTEELTSWQRLNPLATYSPRDKAIRLLSKRFDVEAVRKSNIINISCDATSPELAQRIVARAIVLAREIHLRVNRSAESFDFFDAQARRQDELLASLEEDLRKAKNATGVSEVAAQRTILLERLAALEQDRLRARAAYDSAEAEIRSRTEAIQEMPAMHISSETTGQTQTTSSRLREQLFALEIREKELASKFQADTFVMRQIRDQISEAKRVLSQEIEPVQTTKSLNEAHQQTRIALLESKAKSAAFAAQIKTLDEELAETRQKLQIFNADEVTIARLDRQINLQETAFLKFSENRELARIDRALQDQRMSNLNVLQSPTRSLTPTKPRMMFNQIFGLALASIASVVVAGFSEARRGRPNHDKPSPFGESSWIEGSLRDPLCGMSS